jgi:hypothetical protein
MGWKEVVKAVESSEFFQEVNASFEAGLSDEEVAAVEARFGFRFPPDLRGFLQTALPVGGQFPDWRNGDDSDIEARLRRPLDDLLAAAVDEGFWPPAWPTRPSEKTAAKQIVRDLVARAPKLIPVFSHRYMPDAPPIAGNPVISWVQANIAMCYGESLARYLMNEFPRHEENRDGVKAPDNWRRIKFWDIEVFDRL